MQITLFFTYRVGLSTWQQRGLFSREVGYYQALTKNGAARVVFITYDPTDIQYIDVLRDSNIVLCVRPTWMPALVFSLVSPVLFWRVMKQTTILKTNQMSGAWSGVIAKILWRKPLVVRTGYTWSETKKHQRLFFMFLFARVVEYTVQVWANSIIVTTATQAQLLPAIYQKKVVVIPNYIDTNLFSPRADASIKKDAVYTVVTVGRLALEKNLVFLLDSIQCIPHVRLIVVGDGELSAFLRQYAVGSNIPVTFMGVVANDALPRVLQQADIFVLTSFFEGNPKALLEAMSCGLPVIAGRVPGVVDVVEDGSNGFLSDLEKEQFVSKITYVREHLQEAQRMGAAARQWVIAHQSLESVLSKERALFISLV
jgi:glycosyltransferase involved in cell wall biosynthesis